MLFQNLSVVSTMLNINAHTTFSHSSGLTRNLTFSGIIYHALYLQMLRFYLVRAYYNNNAHHIIIIIITNIEPSR